MSKIFMSGLIGIACSVLFVMPVSAHGHHSRQTGCGADTDHLCEVCSYSDCTRTGWHVHDDVTYCGFDHEEGYCDGTCAVVKVCTVENCQETKQHVHDGVSYCGYAHESGYCDGACGSVEVCTVESCDKTGRHTHDGVTWCGYDHKSGYCDGSCGKTTGTVVRRHGRHHGHH